VRFSEVDKVKLYQVLYGIEPGVLTVRNRHVSSQDQVVTTTEPHPSAPSKQGR
jgi:hypothetical protein